MDPQQQMIQALMQQQMAGGQQGQMQQHPGMQGMGQLRQAEMGMMGAPPPPSMMNTPPPPPMRPPMQGMGQPPMGMMGQ